MTRRGTSNISMSDHQVERLANLLERAVSSVMVTHDYSKQQIDVPTYQQKLRRHWDRHFPASDLSHPRYYTPTAASGELQDQLLATVRRELDQHVREGSVQTAAIVAVGGYGPGFTLVDVVGRLIEVAIGRGHWHAAPAFYQGIREARITYRRIALLTGVRLDLEVPVRPGIRMIPLPNDTADLPAYFPHMSFIDSGDLLGRTLIVVDYTVQPTFADPDPLSLPEDMFQRQQECSELPNFDIHQFCDALSLATDGPIACMAEWTHVDPDAIFIPQWPYTGAERLYPLAPRPRGSVKATASSVKEAVSLYEARRSLSAGSTQVLEVPIQRWIKSKTDQLLPDRFIDLRIALESLYLKDFLNEHSQEMRFRLSLFGAWHLGSEIGDRRWIRKRLRDAYDVASGSVHSGVLEYTAENRELLSDAQDLCRRGILKLLREGHPHDWGDLILGAGDSDST